MRRNLILMLTIFLGLTCASGAQASDLSFTPRNDAVPSNKPMPDGETNAPQPSGFLSFWMRFADQCVLKKSDPARVELTPALWNQLDTVNQAVDRAIRPMDDLSHYGRADYWTIPTDGLGDCEDYALTKRKALIDAGIPARALRIAVVTTWRGERHAVLTVATDHGDYVLDNLVQRVRSWDDTDYQWIARQDPDNGWGWVSLSSKPARVAAVGGAGHG